MSGYKSTRCPNSQSKIRLRELILFLFFVLAIANCFTFDSEIRNFRRSQFSLKLHEVQPSTNAHKKPDVHNLTGTLQEPFYWKHNRNQSNYKESNFLWRNPKVFTNKEATVASSKRKSLIFSTFAQKFTPTTSTYAEFDYLDANYLARNTSVNRLNGFGNRRKVLDNFKTRLPFILQSPSVSYRFNDPYNLKESVIHPTSNTPNNLLDSVLYSHAEVAELGINKIDHIENDFKIIDSVSNDAQTILGQTMKSKTTLKISLESSTSAPPISLTMPDDRVKFFEMYDINTPPNKIIKLNRSDEIQSRSKNVTNTNIYKESENLNNLWGVNSNTTRIERFDKNFEKRSFKQHSELANLNHILELKLLGLHDNLKENSTLLFSKLDTATKTVVARWSSYPFASVYIYKPTETHCDAAGISPHWLLAAGSCLSRYTFVYTIDEQSAYVTYCGEHWRSPERITYVKRSVVHPKFNPKDKVRRLLYNIGLIQVSSSMATSCPRWAPVALMSHQFSTSTAGTVASAVGWGLDRYGSQYTTENDDKLPHLPLSVYDALVYYDTCPGSPTLSQEKRQDDSGAKNVYCLLLPPYKGEESDPVHGGLLLVGGHLAALYLQEERSPWGSQSAQYTGVWRLLPWINSVAREPDDAVITLDV